MEELKIAKEGFGGTFVCAGRVKEVKDGIFVRTAEVDKENIDKYFVKVVCNKCKLEIVKKNEHYTVLKIVELREEEAIRIDGKFAYGDNAIEFLEKFKKAHEGMLIHGYKSRKKLLYADVITDTEEKKLIWEAILKTGNLNNIENTILFYVETEEQTEQEKEKEIAKEIKKLEEKYKVKIDYRILPQTNYIA